MRGWQGSGEEDGREWKGEPWSTKVLSRFKVKVKFKAQGQIYIIKDDPVLILSRLNGERRRRGTRRPGEK